MPAELYQILKNTIELVQREVRISVCYFCPVVFSLFFSISPLYCCDSETKGNKFDNEQKKGNEENRMEYVHSDNVGKPKNQYPSTQKFHFPY